MGQVVVKVPFGSGGSSGEGSGRPPVVPPPPRRWRPPPPPPPTGPAEEEIAQLVLAFRFLFAAASLASLMVAGMALLGITQLARESTPVASMEPMVEGARDAGGTPAAPVRRKSVARLIGILTGAFAAFVAYGLGVLWPVKPWVWEYGLFLLLIMAAAAATTCCFLVIVVPLLYYWCRSDTRAYFRSG